MQDWDTLPADERTVRPDDGSVCRVPRRTPTTTIGPLDSTSSTSIGELDNTLIMFISDNGASAEGGPHGSVNENKFFNNVPDSLEENLEKIDDLGGPKTFNHYPWGWTFAGNTPFRRWKRETYRGGISDPFIVHWPKGIKAKGEIRTQYRPRHRHGANRARGARARGSRHRSRASPSRRSRDSALPMLSTTQRRHATTSPSTSKMFGHRRSITTAGVRCAPGPARPLRNRVSPFGAPIDKDKLTELDAKGWELYHVDTDFAENHDLAAENRAKLIEMIATWYVEAGSMTCCPSTRGGNREPRIRDRRSPSLAPATPSIPTRRLVPVNAGPNIMNRPFSITAEVEIPKGGAEGVLLSSGDVQGGLPSMCRTASSTTCTPMSAAILPHRVDLSVPVGRHKLRFEFETTGEMDYKDGKGAPGRRPDLYRRQLVGQGDIPLTMAVMIGLAGGFVCGADIGSPRLGQVQAAFKFTGTLYSTIIDLSGEIYEILRSRHAHRSGAPVGSSNQWQPIFSCSSQNPSNA